MAIRKPAPKTETKTAVVVTPEKAPEKAVAVQSTLLPSLVGASPEIMERMVEVQDNLESVESFRLPRAKMTADGFELIEGEDIVTELEGVILHTKKTNVYYSKPYNADDVTAPDCFSLDGDRPDKSVKEPVNPTCKGCPMAEFGTNQRGSGKACRNLKPLYMLLSDEAIMPRQLTVTPASLKAANQYLMDLTERGLSYRKVKTKIIAYKESRGDTYMKLRFVMGKKLDEQQTKNVEFLKNQWRPIMDAQVVDQREVDSASPSQVNSAVGEY